ncbi:MAG: acyl carrier protein [Candidatus Aureabacteria bacterium]|nr:acyl carrier protein [Candidatus Auribacterota bacterium]
MNIEEKIISIIQENLEEKHPVTLESDLRNDLTIDSFGTIMILNSLEDEFGITIDEHDFKDIVKVNDVINHIKSKINESQ